VIDEDCDTELHTYQKCVIFKIPVFFFQEIVSASADILYLPSCYSILFSCAAATQTIIEQDLAKLSESDQSRVMKEAHRLT